MKEKGKKGREGDKPYPLSTFLAMYPLGPSFAIIVI